MTRERAEFLALMLRQGTPLERESIAELVEHALATTSPKPAKPSPPLDLGVKKALLKNGDGGDK